jgi:hypothetical protein
LLLQLVLLLLLLLLLILLLVLLLLLLVLCASRHDVWWLICSALLHQITALHAQTHARSPRLHPMCCCC